MVRIAIFASGSGTNAENIVDYFKDNAKVEVACIITNKEDAFVLKRAKKLGVESAFFSKDDFNKSSKVVQYLIEKKIDFIVLAGFLIKIPQNILDLYPSNIVNIHPALLPRYGGKGMYGDNVHKAVVAAGDSQTGITIHYVNENYDEGAIIFQAKCSVGKDDTYEDVAQKVHALEYEHFPKVIQEVLENKCFY